jgi:hypothetical protein
MIEEKALKRLAKLLEKQIAFQLHFAGASQDAIARSLKKRKRCVNDVLRVLPRQTQCGIK